MESHSRNQNQTGSYDVKGLAAGKYGIKVTAPGFAVYEVDGIEVGPGQSQKMDVSLSIEVQQENVNVSEQSVGSRYVGGKQRYADGAVGQRPGCTVGRSGRTGG